MSDYKYIVRVGTRNVQLNSAGDALAVGDAVRDLHRYETGEYGYVMPKHVIISWLIIALAVDTAIVVGIYNLLG